jgi:hypothetical protein
MQVYRDVNDFVLNYAALAPALTIEECSTRLLKDYGVEIKASPIHGRGVFTTRRWPAHSVVMRYPVESIVNQPLNKGYDFYLGWEHGKEYYSSYNGPTDVAHLINSCCVPNVAFVICKTGKMKLEGKFIDKRLVVVVTLRTIKKGTELVADYFHDDRQIKCIDRMNLVLKALHPVPEKRKDRGAPLMLYTSEKGRMMYFNIQWVTRITVDQVAYSAHFMEEPSTPEYFLKCQVDQRMGRWLVKTKSVKYETKDGDKHMPLFGTKIWPKLPDPLSWDDGIAVAEYGWSLLTPDGELCDDETEFCRCGLSKGSRDIKGDSPRPHTYAEGLGLAAKKYIEARTKSAERKKRKKTDSSTDIKEKKAKTVEKKLDFDLTKDEHSEKQPKSPCIYGSIQHAEKQINWIIDQMIKEATESENPVQMLNLLRQGVKDDVLEVFENYLEKEQDETLETLHELS